MMVFRAIVMIGYCLLIPSVAAAVSVSQSIDRTEMPFEGSARFEIAISWEGSPTALRFDKPLRLEADKLKVASFSSRISSAGTGANEVTTKVLTYVLQPTQSGLATVNPAVIEYVTWPDSVAAELSTDAVSITVAEPRPASKSPGGLPIWLLIVAPVAIILAAGTFGLVVWRKRKPREIPKSPVQVLLEELARIRSEAGNDLKQFQTDFYKSLVTFLNVKYKISVDGRSTDDIVSQLEKTSLTVSQRETIGGWLKRAEREKYIPLQAGPGETIRRESEIRDFFMKI
jgi:hypothetical protein